MKLTTLTLALLGTLSLAAAGCVGEIPPGPGTGGDGDGDGDGDVDAGTPVPGPDNEAQALFESNVFPIITASCGDNGAGCHAGIDDPKFVGNDLTDAYIKMMQNQAQLLENLDADTATLVVQGIGGGHKGVDYSADDIQAIKGWINAEKTLADGGGGGGTPVSPLSEWSGCMDLQDWLNTEVSDRFARKNAGNQGDCEECHELGADGFIASRNEAQSFKYVSEYPQFITSYFTVDEAGTAVVVNEPRLLKVGNRLAPHGEHGGFDLDDNAGAALQEFYNLTKARLDAGNCGPPRF